MLNPEQMAGSYKHVVDSNNKFIGLDLIENLGDAYECIEEMYQVIQKLSGGDKQRIYEAWLHSGAIHPENIPSMTPERFWGNE